MNRMDDDSSPAAPKMTSSDRPVLDPKTESALLEYAVEIGRTQVKAREIAEERRAKAAAREAQKTLAHAESRIPFGWTAVHISGGASVLGYEIESECLVPLPCVRTADDLVVERIAPRTDMRVAPPDVIRALFTHAKIYALHELVADPEVMERVQAAAVKAIVALRDFDERHDLERSHPELHRINVEVGGHIARDYVGCTTQGAVRALDDGWSKPYLHDRPPANVQATPHTPLHASVLDAAAQVLAGAPSYFDEAGLRAIVAEVEAERANVAAFASVDTLREEIVRTTPRAANVIVLRKPTSAKVRPVHRIMIANELTSEVARSETFVRDGEARQCFARVWPFGVAAGVFEEVGAIGPSWIIVGDDEEIDLTRGEIEDAQRRLPRVALLHQLASEARTQPGALEPVTSPIDLRSASASRKALKIFRSLLKGPLGEMAFGREDEAAHLLRWVVYGVGARGCSLLPELVAPEIEKAFKGNKAAADVATHKAACVHVQTNGGYCAPGALIATKEEKKS